MSEKETVEKKVRLKVNGTWFEGEAKPGESLLRFLRENNFTEVKNGCEAGECGACTVLLDGVAVNSCLVPVYQADGSEVMTVKNEGDQVLEKLKEKFVENEALQCGFCTPGFLMTARWFLEKEDSPTEAEIREAISGNLCRCTGYKKIIEAIKLASEEVT